MFLNIIIHFCEGLNYIERLIGPLTFVFASYLSLRIFHSSYGRPFILVKVPLFEDFRASRTSCLVSLLHIDALSESGSASSESTRFKTFKITVFQSLGKIFKPAWRRIW